MRREPRMLLLQARHPDDPMAAHEHRCFVATTGLPPENIVTYDLLDGPPTVAEVRGHDALTVGGSGDFYVSERNLPGFEQCLDVLVNVVETGHPTFASCFGYQCMIVALGGRVVHDPLRTEVGTFELTLTDHARDDELFGELPPKFQAQMGHKDRAAQQPCNVPNLARSASCPLQALRIPGKPVWATQFHPELTRETNLDRFNHYIENYASGHSEDEIRKTRSGFLESPEASSLLRRFIRLVFG